MAALAGAVLLCALLNGVAWGAMSFATGLPLWMVFVFYVLTYGAFLFLLNASIKAESK